MEKKQGGMSQEEYIRWLESLAHRKAPDRARKVVLPCVIIEETRGAVLTDIAEWLFTPLEHLALFPFQGEYKWVALRCADWGDTKQLPELMMQKIVTVTGLYGRFRGGVVIDLRCCEGRPCMGQLRELERFLVEAGEDLCPLLLVAPGAADEVRAQLTALDVQRILSTEDISERLTAELAGVEGLTQEGKTFILRCIEQGEREEAAALLRLVHRLTAVMQEPIDEEQLAACLPSKGSSSGAQRRRIGFERGEEYERD